MHKFDDFYKVKVLVVGDVMLDQYWWGEVSRISPEAPVPIVALDKKSSVAGGAANVASNVVGLKATPYLVGVIGEDSESQGLQESLEDEGISTEYLLSIKDKPTTVKTRIIGGNQQIVRVDHENSAQLSGSQEALVWNRIEVLLDKVDVVLISDYAKGLISDNLSQKLIKESNSRDLLVLVDPKGTDYRKYKHASILTPNEKEALNASGVSFNGRSSVIEAGHALFEQLDLKHLIITRGKDGMMLFSENSQNEELETKARKVFDVTGAGDTVISTLAVGLGADMDFHIACKLANEAAGIVVEKVGTRPIYIEELVQR